MGAESWEALDTVKVNDGDGGFWKMCECDVLLLYWTALLEGFWVPLTLLFNLI